MHLIILTQYYPPEVGAPQARLSELASRFVRAGHKVTVLTAMPNYPTGKIYKGYGGVFKQEQQNGVHIIRTAIYPTQKATFFHRLTNYFSFVLSSLIMGVIFLPAADYLLVESPPLFLGISGLILSRVKRARLIFNVSDLWPESAVHMGIIRPQSLSHRLSSLLEALCYRGAWLISGQSKSILDNIKQRFPDKQFFHLSNGVDVAKFSKEQQTAEARAQLANDDECVVLYAGLHGLAQGLDQILDAAKLLHSKTRLRFVLIGDGPEKERLLARAKHEHLANITFLPPRPAHDIPPLLASADIALIPLATYIPGAVPSKVYEAMASAIPIVLVAEGEAADIVRDNRAGFVVKPGNIPELVDALSKLQNDPDCRAELGSNGRAAAVQSYNRDKIVNRFIQYLQERL